jgi:hypothetical protein
MMLVEAVEAVVPSWAEMLVVVVSDLDLLLP